MVNFSFRYISLLLLIALCTLPFASCAQTKSVVTKTIDGKKYIIHKVEKGESLYAISRLYGLDVNTVVINNHDAIDGLQVGQELRIPTNTDSAQLPIINTSTTLSNQNPIDTLKYICHKVQKGETIYGITKKYNIDEKTLISYNPTINSGIKEGNVLIVGLKKVVNSTTSTTSSIQPTTTSTVNNLQSSNLQSVTPTSNTDSLLLSKQKKSAYRIGLFLPFKLNQLDLINIDELVQKKSSFPTSQAIAMDFYTGFKKVVDSLSTQNFDITLSLFDVDERDSAKIESICKSAEFKRLDAIFGPLSANEFKIVASKAKTLGIPAVAPMVQNNKILFNNSLLSKVNPSQHTLIEGLADYCLDSLPNSNVILVSTTAKDVAYTKTFKKRFNDNLFAHGKATKDTLAEVKGIAGVKNVFRSDKKNIVIAFTNNPVYLQDFITQLANFSDKKDFVLVGFGSVANIENLDQEYLNRLHFHFATTNHTDYINVATTQLAKQYQDIFNTEPSDFYFEGYDVASYYLSNIKKDGLPFFANLDKVTWKGISTDFKFYRPDSATGFENRAMSIYKYNDYKLVKTGW